MAIVDDILNLKSNCFATTLRVGVPFRAINSSSNDFRTFIVNLLCERIVPA